MHTYARTSDIFREPTIFIRRGKQFLTILSSPSFFDAERICDAMSTFGALDSF